MAWGPEKRAGFALAALLSDDRELSGAGPALQPGLRQALAVELAAAREHKADAIAGWLSLLRPALDESALSLPPRARALLAPLAPPSLRRALLAAGLAPRAHYAADPELVSALLRMARKLARGRTP